MLVTFFARKAAWLKIMAVQRICCYSDPRVKNENTVIMIKVWQSWEKRFFIPDCQTFLSCSIPLSLTCRCAASCCSLDTSLAILPRSSLISFCKRQNNISVLHLHATRTLPPCVPCARQSQHPVQPFALLVFVVLPAINRLYIVSV